MSDSNGNIPVPWQETEHTRLVLDGVPQAWTVCKSSANPQQGDVLLCHCTAGTIRPKRTKVQPAASTTPQPL